VSVGYCSAVCAAVRTSINAEVQLYMLISQFECHCPHNAQSFGLYCASVRGSNCMFCCHVIPLHSNVSCQQFVTTTVCFAHTRARARAEDLVRACMRASAFFTFHNIQRISIKFSMRCPQRQNVIKMGLQQNRAGGGEGFTGLVFLRIGTAGGPLRLRKRTFEWLKTR